MSCFDSQAKCMESDEDDFLLSGLMQNTFLLNRIILDDEQGIIIASISESENSDFVDCKESTSANTSHAASTNKRNISMISDEEFEQRKESRIPLNSKHNIAWAVGAWKEWADERNHKALVKNDKVRKDFDIKQGRAGKTN